MEDTKFFLTEEPAPESVKDISDFGNQPLQDISSHGLVYDVEISGIDSPEQKLELEGILMDKKLGISFQETIAKVTDGCLKIENLNPVKASVLVNRIKQTHLRVIWKTVQSVKR